MTISIIAAMAENGLIGKANSLPWHLPADLKHFKELTLNKAVLMGEKTFFSIGKPLKDRLNIVLSDNPVFEPSGCLLARSIEQAINLAKEKNVEELMVIGGASVYKQFLPLADKMYLTVIKGDFEGDIYFPKYDKSQWQEVSRQKNQPDEKNPYSYDFITLEKTAKVD
jgi:dihydrofolate reductase